ncbi:hypothetical protein JL721_569 [Aureococcus anophagefferens]|nr:hypothetical protein JL721_569 [Aureococcus anophagefferens]
MAVVGLLLCAAACLAGEVAKPRLVRTPKQRPARVRITPAGDADAAPPPANASQDDARRRLRDRITNPPTSVPTITYSGVLEAPLILPPSGAVDAAVGITFLHELGPGVVVHCTTDGSEPDRWSTKYLSGGMIHMSGTQHPTLTLRCLARAPERLDEEYRDSAIVTRTYEVQMGTYDYDRSGYTGRNYIDTTVDYAPAPSGHSAKLPSVDLNTSTYKSVRIHGVETDFAEYYTYDYKGEAADVVYKGKFVPATLQYQRGTGAYDGQVRLHDMAAYANDTMLRGFFHGFVQEHARRNSTERKAISMHYHRRFLVSEDELAVAVAKFGCSPSDRRDPVHMTKNTSRLSVETYGFLAPYFDGVSYSGKAVRLRLGTTYQEVVLAETTLNVSRCCIVNVTKELCVFNGTVKEPSGRVSLETVENYREGNLTADPDGDAPGLTESIDLTKTHERLRGFVGGFAVGDYAYFVPHFDGRNPGHVVARVDAVNFDESAVEFLDLWDYDTLPHGAGTLGGFFSGFGYTTTGLRAGDPRAGVEYGFLVPHCNIYGKLVRLALANFTSGDLTTAVDVLDLTEIDPDLRGFAGGAVIGRYGLLVPYKNRPGDRGFFGKLVRVDLETFEVEQVLDLTRIEINSETTEIAGDALRGFIGGINFGKYLVLVPHRNGLRDTNYNKRDHSSHVVRVDMDDFTLETGVKVIDLSRVARLQIPSEPDNELRGFVFGFAMGEYAYLVPHFSRDFYGKIVRVDMRDFDNLADLQAADESTEVEVGTPGAYSGVQYVDLERSDRELVGFSGGFAVRSAEPLFSRELATPEARSEWWTSSMDVRLRDADAATPDVRAFHEAHIVRSDIVRGCLGWEDVCDDQPVSHEPSPPRRASRR